MARVRSVVSLWELLGKSVHLEKKIIFQISTVLTILGDSQDLKPYVSKMICTFS